MDRKGAFTGPRSTCRAECNNNKVIRLLHYYHLRLRPFPPPSSHYSLERMAANDSTRSSDPRSALIGKRRRDKGKVAITLPHGWQPLSRLNPPRYDCFCDLKLVQYIQIVLVYILLFSLISPQWQYVELSISFHV